MEIPLNVSANASVNKWLVVGVAVILIAGFAYYVYTVEKAGKAAELGAVPKAAHNLGSAANEFWQGLTGQNTNTNLAGG